MSSGRQVRALGMKGSSPIRCGGTPVALDSMVGHRPRWRRSWWLLPLALLALPLPLPASAATPATFQVLRQSPTANLVRTGVGRVVLDLALPERTGASVRATMYPRLVMLSQIGPIVAGTGVAGPGLASTPLMNPRCGRRSAAVVVAVVEQGARPPRTRCGEGVVRLPCRGFTCDGVYPLRLRVVQGGRLVTTWSLLAVQASHVLQPVRFAWIATLDASAWQHRKRTEAFLDALAHQSALPLTLSADYDTLAAALTSPIAGPRWRRALAHAVASPLHRAVAAPPARADLTGLANAGLHTELVRQVNLGAQLYAAASGRYVDGPLLLSGPTTPGTLDGLAGAGVSDVVLPESDLGTAPSSTLTWGEPFRVTGATGVTAVATDQPLSNLLLDSAIEPGRRAALVLATLAFLHFEAPNATAPRTVVVDTPAASVSPAVLADVASGLIADPFVVPTALGPAFDSSLVGADGAPTARALGPSTPSTLWSPANVAELQSVASEVDAFTGAITSRVESVGLRVALADAEAVGPAGARQSRIAAVGALVAHQLAYFSIDPGAITLAGAGSDLPITVRSGAPYALTGVVHLLTSDLTFPKGSAVAVSVTPPITALRVPVVSRGGSLTLQVNLTTANGQLLIAHAAIQVRAAGASLVGYLLTAASILVLAVWWLRSYRRRARGRHAR